MELKNIQKQCYDMVKEVDKKCNCNHDIDTTFIHLIEEVGEVARLIIDEKIDRDKLDKNHLGEEFADIFFFLSRLANHYDIDLEKAIKQKLNKLKDRFEVK